MSSFRLTENQRVLVKRAAERAGLSMIQWVRHAIEVQDGIGYEPSTLADTRHVSNEAGFAMQIKLHPDHEAKLDTLAYAWGAKNRGHVIRAILLEAVDIDAWAMPPDDMSDEALRELDRATPAFGRTTLVPTLWKADKRAIGGALPLMLNFQLCTYVLQFGRSIGDEADWHSHSAIRRRERARLRAAAERMERDATAHGGYVPLRFETSAPVAWLARGMGPRFDCPAPVDHLIQAALAVAWIDFEDRTTHNERNWL